VSFNSKEWTPDLLTAYEAVRAKQSIPDRGVLEFGIRQGRAVLTFNRRDFKPLRRNVRPSCGFAICAGDPAVIGLATRTHQALAA
jgi:hypothetical protein